MRPMIRDRKIVCPIFPCIHAGRQCVAKTVKVSAEGNCPADQRGCLALRMSLFLHAFFPERAASSLNWVKKGAYVISLDLATP